MPPDKSFVVAEGHRAVEQGSTARSCTGGPGGCSQTGADDMVGLYDRALRCSCYTPRMRALPLPGCAFVSWGPGGMYAAGALGGRCATCG